MPLDALLVLPCTPAPTDSSSPLYPYAERARTARGWCSPQPPLINDHGARRKLSFLESCPGSLWGVTYYTPRHQWDQDGASSYRALTEGAPLFISFPSLLPFLPSCSPWESFVRKSLCLNPHLKSASRKTHLRHWFTAAAQRNLGSFPPRSSIYLSASGISGIWEHISPGVAPAPLFLFLQDRLVLWVCPADSFCLLSLWAWLRFLPGNQHVCVWSWGVKAPGLSAILFVMTFTVVI